MHTDRTDSSTPGPPAAPIDHPDHKSTVRERVFADLRKVAFPDSRFHYDFGEFITDFVGSSAATDRLMAHRFYQDAQCIFITPDNCIEELRYRTLCEGKLILLTTYSIKRGFWLLDPATIPKDRSLYPPPPHGTGGCAPCRTAAVAGPCSACYPSRGRGGWPGTLRLGAAAPGW